MSATEGRASVRAVLIASLCVVTIGVVGVLLFVQRQTADHLSPDDRAYIETLEINGLSVTDEQRAIQQAHGICKAFRDGQDFRSVKSALSAYGVPSTHASMVIGMSVGRYCYDLRDVLTAG